MALQFSEQDFAPKDLEFTEADFSTNQPAQSQFSEADFSPAPATTQTVTEQVLPATELPREAGGMPIVKFRTSDTIRPATTMEKIKGFRLPGQNSSVWQKLFGQDKEFGHDVGALEAVIANPANMIGPAGVAGKGIAAYFAVNFLKEQPAVLEQLKQEIKAGDKEAASLTVLKDLIAGGMIAVGGKLAFSSEAGPVRPEPIVESLKEANAPATAEAVKAVVAAPETAPGGSPKDLSPELAAKSEANNSREAFAKLQAEADAAKLKSEIGVFDAIPKDKVLGQLAAMFNLKNKQHVEAALDIPDTATAVKTMFQEHYPPSHWSDVALEHGVTPEAAYNEALQRGITILDQAKRALGKQTTSNEKAQITQGREALTPDQHAVAPPADAGPAEFPTSGENVEMRKSAARAVESPSIPEPIQEKIAEAPESFYKQQSTAEVSRVVSGMGENELAGVPRDSNLYVAAKLEQAKRLFNAGKNDEGYEAFVQLEKEGTRLGQLINQFKFLDSVNPSSVATIVDKRLVKAGRDPLTEPQRTKIIDITKKSQESNRELETAKNDWLKNPTDENAAKAEDALNKSNDTEVELQRTVDRHEVRTIPGTLSTILKGNLLTPISQIANVIGNVSFIPFRSSARAVASGLDVIDAYVRNRPREITVSPIEGTKAAAKGIVKGVSQIPDIALRGSSTIKGEKSTGLHPLRAWVEQFSKNPDVPTIEGKVPYSERARLALEGTLGIPAETMLRGLAAGDRPFRESAQARIIANEAKLAKIPREKWNMAQKFPELFFDRATMERIQEETLGAIFQRQSNSIRYIMKLFSSRGDWMELATSTVAPYKLTPWNIAAEILSYNPVVAAAQTSYHAKQGNSRAAKLSAGKLVVGSMLTAGGFYLYKQGLLAPSMDSPDERTKARILAGEILPPNHINVSGLDRLMAGGDPAFKPGDKTMDVFRAGGLAGSMFYMTANIGRDMEKQPAAEDDVLMSVLRNSTIEQARFAMNQSFLQGVGGLFEAIKGGDTDSYVKKWANTTMSIALPNTLNTMSRAVRPEKIQVDGFEDLVRSRLGVFGTDDALPLKRGLWGEPIPETPKDRNAIIYHFFDITKQRQVTDDPVAIEIYKLWRTSNDTSVIPTPPSKSVTFNKQAYTLNAEQQSNLSELVGKARRGYAEAIINNPEWQTLPAEFKIKVLGQVYDKGLEVGKAQYFLTEPKLEPKKKPAGFNN